jgi:hypothetical protein
MKCPVTKKNCKNPKCAGGCLMEKKRAAAKKIAKPVRKIKKKG